MAYNLELEAKIDDATKRWKNLVKKKMFGGVGWLLNGNMCFGIWKNSLVVRMDKEEGERRLREKDAQPFDITGKPMAGWIMVKETGWKTGAGLTKWIGIGKAHALTLPEKKAGNRKKKTLREYRA